MPTYYANFANSTPQTWTMAVWQTLPESPGLDSVSWKQTSTPKGGSSGVSWDVEFDAVLANYVQTKGIGVYTASQTLATALGTSWDIVFADGVQQLQAASGPVPSDSISIANQSGYLANPGIGMSGSGSVYQRAVYSGASALFKVVPTYWVGLFNNVTLGQVISSDVVVGPIQIIFPSGNNAANVSAYISGQTINLSVQYGQQVSASVTEMEERINLLARAS